MFSECCNVFFCVVYFSMLVTVKVRVIEGRILFEGCGLMTLHMKALCFSHGIG